MNGAVAGLLAGLVLAGFARPRWWLALVPVALTIGLGAYRLSLPRNASADEVAFLGIVLLTVAMESSLVAGALARAGFERAQSRPARAGTALRAARGIALTGVAFVGAAIVVSRATSGLALVLSVVAVGVVLARAWRARLRRGPGRRPHRAVPATRPVRTRATVAVRDRRRPPGRRGASGRGYRRRISS